MAMRLFKKRIRHFATKFNSEIQKKLCNRPQRGTHNVAKICLKNLANLKTCGKNFGDVFFDAFRPAESESLIMISGTKLLPPVL